MAPLRCLDNHSPAVDSLAANPAVPDIPVALQIQAAAHTHAPAVDTPAASLAVADIPVANRPAAALAPLHLRSAAGLHSASRDH
jgi:hypothetical protein